MWLVSSMIISIIKFRFHVQSTAQLNYLLSIIPMWLVSSMIISIIKFRFHVQSTAQLNYLLSTIVYVPDSKSTYNVTNALLYSQRLSRDLSPPEIATSAPSENALWVFRMRINASCF